MLYIHIARYFKIGRDTTSWKKFKPFIWDAMDNPSSSVLAQIISIFLLFLILFSTVSFVLETLPAFRNYDNMWNTIEAFCVYCFTAEFSLRVTSTPNLSEYVWSPFNMIDFFSIAPYYIELASETSGSSGSAVFRVVRLVRVFRVFKISRYLSWVKMFTNSMAKSLQPLGKKKLQNFLTISERSE